jgi:GAF domain-containing protein
LCIARPKGNDAVSKFDLRDISDRLASSTDTESVVQEFLGYLQSIHSDWRGALAFYEVSRDSIVNVYELGDGRLVRREVTMPVDHLPARLVRKVFHPNAFFNEAGARPTLAQWLNSSPIYEPDQDESVALAPLFPMSGWRSSACLALADHDDVLGLLVLASEKKNAFAAKAIEEIMPVKNMAALALAQHLHRASWSPEAEADARTVRQAAQEFQERLRHLTQHARELEEDNRAKADRLAQLVGEIEKLDHNSSHYKQELDRVKGTVLALEEQTSLATEHLSDAYTQLDMLQNRLADLESTIGFMRQTLQALSHPYHPGHLAHAMVSSVCEHFALERCSLMLIDPNGDTMSIAAQSGIPEEIAARVKVRVGQGISGWVARHHKPLFVRVDEDIPAISREVKETYNSDSFICVPLIHAGRALGVLNFSNKRDGEPFDDADFDRATLAATILAMTLDEREELKIGIERRAA